MRTIFGKQVRAFVVGAALLMGAGQAHAVPTTGLWLAMDGSGSINNTDFAVQVNGYVGALNAFFANNPTAYGQVAIGGSIFGANINTFFGIQTITNATVLGNLTSAISALNPGRGGINTGGTAIGDAITNARGQLLAFETSLGSPLRLVIDVTTDGQNNVGALPGPAATAAIGAGIDQVNCLGIGAGASCAWVGSNGINFGVVDTFAEFQAAFTRKIQLEVVGEVPEPATLALFGLALAGLGVARRRAA